MNRVLPGGLVDAVAGVVTGDGRVAAADLSALIHAFGLPGPDAVMVAALPAATALADPPI